MFLSGQTTVRQPENPLAEVIDINQPRPIQQVDEQLAVTRPQSDMTTLPNSGYTKPTAEKSLSDRKEAVLERLDTGTTARPDGFYRSIANVVLDGTEKLNSKLTAPVKPGDLGSLSQRHEIYQDPNRQVKIK